MPTSPEATADVFEMLADQHAEIRRLIERTRTDRASASALADYVAAHLAVERELLFPLLARQLSEQVRRELVLEHAEIRRVLGMLVWLDVDDVRYAPALDELALLVEGHAGWQDGELAERLAPALPATARADLGTSVRAGFDRIWPGDPLIAA